MPSLFTPCSIAIKKGSHRGWKPTILESMRAFIAVLPVGADLEKFKEERHTECRKHSITWQPQVVVLGTSIVDVQQVFAFLNDIIYSVPSVVKGIDVCFKTFQVFNIEYPLECKSPWTFLQKGIYGIETPYDSMTPRVRELLSILRPDSDHTS
ncbi:hypothetical protein HOLleu_04250 [Holothuria leucospilota]|uniref:Uncharacterized protein n=1 Tax=Holothuria leucospilota TaxID=206669 RepID=A0A9Q1HKP7_HOLLE|nr:hypothetical protein HOLleu_04250 [Holothuria leucospilota]